jgi:glycosyltransferase involved in cell wall biosynthesis
MKSLVEPWPARVRYPIVLATTVTGRFVPSLGYRAWDLALRDHRDAFEEIVRLRPDVIVANDWNALPIAVRAQARTGAKIVADLHEYAPLHWENRKVWMALISPMIDFHLRRAAPHIASAVTVCQTIAERYEREYGLRCGVVRNIPAAKQLASFRATDPGKIRLVHHGNATRDRMLHLMVEAVAKSDARYSLHFHLIDNDRAYLEELKRLSSTMAPGRVSFDDPMPPAEIVSTIARYDMGIHLLPPSNFNHYAALPNKFFDFVFAGLGVCVGPSPEMARIVKEHGCGIVVPSFEPDDIAAALNRMTAPELDAMKQRAIAACASFSPQREMQTMRDAVARVLA